MPSAWLRNSDTTQLSSWLWPPNLNVSSSSAMHTEGPRMTLHVCAVAPTNFEQVLFHCHCATEGCGFPKPLTRLRRLAVAHAARGSDPRAAWHAPCRNRAAILPRLPRNCQKPWQAGSPFPGKPHVAHSPVPRGHCVTRQAPSPSVTLNPSGSRHSCRTIRPGCGGFFIGMAIPSSDRPSGPRPRHPRPQSAR